VVRSQGHRLEPYKKTPLARERDRDDVRIRREAFLEAQPHLDPTRLIFLDESGFRLGSPPHYGWSPRGAKAFGKGIHGRWTTITMLGAIALDGFRGFFTVDAATDRDVFLVFVEQVLVPNLRPGDIVVMDNLSVHYSTAAQEAIRAAGAEVMYLPPYSPEFNPIEKAWSKLKAALRRSVTLTRETFDHAVTEAMDTITTNDIREWTAYAGYAIAST